MISVIIASRNDTLLNDVTQSIKNTIGVKHEIIVVKDILGNKGICKVYNEGACKAIYQYLCFVHEDVIFHTNNWGKCLIKHLDNSAIALVGIFGSVVKTKVPSGVHIPIENLNRVNQRQRNKDGTSDHYYDNPLNEPYSEVAVLDGMFLANTINNHKKYPFDEHLLKGFHGYDIDYSLGQSRLGQIVVIYDILIEHFSHGGNSISWIDEQLKVTNKWRNYLPRYISVGKKDILIATIRNTKIFLNVLFLNNYKKGTQLKYLLQLIKLRPFRLANLYYIRKFLIYGKTEHWLKNI